MPGISLVVCSDVNKLPLERALADMKSEYSGSAAVLYRDDRCAFIFSGSEDHPRWFHEDNTSVIFFEGMVYNRTMQATTEMLLAIACTYSSGSDIDEIVRHFVAQSDGDFLCAVYAKESPSLLLFNDRFGRLPSFYHEGAGMFAASREIKFLLHFIPEIAVDRFGLSQFLMFEYTLGDTTIFRGIRRVLASCVIKAHGESSDGGIKVIRHESLPVNFDETDRPSSREECTERLRMLFMESLENRYSRCREHGYSCIADVSGGFDTRTVMTGLEKIGADVLYFTHRLVSGDESHVALKIGELCEKPVRIVSASHTLDYDEMEKLVYAADCMVNGWTALTSWRDSSEKRRMLGGKTACFMGFGGEFIRHPFLPAWGHHSLQSMLRSNILKAPLTARWASFLGGIPHETFLELCDAYFDTYVERTIAGKLKHLYYEYYSILVNAGEDRTRRLFWTVQPLWGKDLYEYEMNGVPLEYAHFAFYTAFMKTIDPRTVLVPVHRSRVRLDSDFSLRMYDVVSTMKYHVRNMVLSNRLTSNFYYRHRGRERNTGAFREAAVKTIEIHHTLERTRNWIEHHNIEYFTAHGYGMKNMYRLLSVLMYCKELEARFHDKLAED